jgi:hypothetical protein
MGLTSAITGASMMADEDPKSEVATSSARSVDLQFAIEVEELHKRYGELEAVGGISFLVTAGETFGFLGPNGAGKSTTISMLCTLLRPTAGRARVAGFDVVEQAAEVRRPGLRCRSGGPRRPVQRLRMGWSHICLKRQGHASVLSSLYFQYSPVQSSCLTPDALLNKCLSSNLNADLAVASCLTTRCVVCNRRCPT